jgi:ribosome-associated protein
MASAGPGMRCVAKEDDVLSQAQDAVRGKTAADAAGARMTGTDVKPTSDQLLDHILTSLDDDKAEEIVKINLRGKSEMADWMVIASGRSSRQVAAIADHLVEKLKQDHNTLCKVEGKDAGDWVLIDAGDVIVHVFRPEVRDFYQLEKMWLSPSEAAAAGR